MRRTLADEIPKKANTLIHLLLIALFVLLLRIWQLSVLERDDRLQEIRKPMRKQLFEPAKRGTIRDRFNVPLAINAINYQAAVVWASIGEIPQYVYEKDGSGQRVKRPLRRPYVEALSNLLGKELGQDARRIEDKIWSTASFYGQAPYVIKEGITEEQYYRLKALGRLWPGIEVQIGSKRRYPQGSVACDILGYMGAINREEYNRVLEEIHLLQEMEKKGHLGEAIPYPIEEVKEKLTALQERAYTIHDQIGKTGVEKRYEQSLRGSLGKKTYESDAKGNFLREIEISKKPRGGQRLLLTISKDLQEYAEQLLAFAEANRDKKPLHAKLDSKEVPDMASPWIKGGAIVALDPNSGEVLALASYPRFDPNDFIVENRLKPEQERIQKVHQWLESDRHIGSIFDQKVPLLRETFDVDTMKWSQEEKLLTWDTYLLEIFMRKSAPYLAIRSIKNLKEGVNFLRNFSDLQEKYPQKSPEELLGMSDSKAMGPLTGQERLLVLNLLRILIDEKRFSPALLSQVGSMSLDQYRQICCQTFKLREQVKEEQKERFHELEFKGWRQDRGQAFLKEKRVIEKQQERYAKPYLDYFDEEEKRQFADYFSKEKENLLLEALKRGGKGFEAIKGLSEEMKQTFFATMRSFDELKEPIIGHLSKLRRGGTLKELSMAFYPQWGWGYGRSFAYRQSAIQGSIFKIVTAYAGLKAKYEQLKGHKEIITRSDLNTFEIIDEVKNEGSKWEVGRYLDGTPIPQLYKGGRIPRSMNYHLGRVDLVRAIETSSNPFFSLMASEIVPSPDYFVETIRSLSYGDKSGIDLTGEISGKVPTDLSTNKTGLYATAIGQHTLVATPLQAAVMLSTIANGGKVYKPQIAHLGLENNELIRYEPQIKRHVPMPRAVQELLFNGMKRVLSHSKPEQLHRFYPGHRDWLKSYGPILKEMMGKTSTSEVLEPLSIGSGNKPYMVNHVWFGGIAFDESQMDGQRELFLAKDPYGKPELVVVVYLRFGQLGKETVPIAALMAKKWREIKNSIVKNN